LGGARFHPFGAIFITLVSHFSFFFLFCPLSFLDELVVFNIFFFFFFSFSLFLKIQKASF